MKLELGRKYLTRGGAVVGPLAKANDLAHPFYYDRKTWAMSGRYSFSYKDHIHDIVAEYHEPVKPYPDHTAPAPPAGHVWEYRGVGWNPGIPVTYYAADNDGCADTLKGFGTPAGASGCHYFEAVPIQSTDPKGESGSRKAPLHLIPSHPVHETSWVLKLGAEKYGPWNFRQGKICTSTYRSAMQRHLDQWFDGLEDADEESGRSHLAHVIASAMIVMDAGKHGTLEDDRPRASGNAIVEARRP
jgi:hypothetical protein